VTPAEPASRPPAKPPAARQPAIGTAATSPPGAGEPAALRFPATSPADPTRRPTGVGKPPAAHEPAPQSAIGATAETAGPSHGPSSAPGEPAAVRFPATPPA